MGCRPFSTALITQNLSAWIFPRIQIKGLDSYFSIQHLYRYLRNYSIRSAEKMETVPQGAELAPHVSRKCLTEQTHLTRWLHSRHTKSADKLQRIRCQKLKICKLQKIITCLTGILSMFKNRCFSDLEAAEPHVCHSEPSKCISNCSRC